MKPLIDNTCVVHCMFEQSGTFKNEFKKLGYKAIDYDILNDFGETNKVVDLYKQINLAFNGGGSLFDDIKENDLIIAFFPCIRFENQMLLHFRGDVSQAKNWTLENKLANNLIYHKELHDNYCVITKLVLVCLRKKLKLIIENPYSTQHYLTRYWCIKPSILDLDRREMGDCFEKPTQYWFINCEPLNQLLFDEPIASYKKKIISFTNDKVERSMITPEYARRFIRTYIVEKEQNG